MRRMFSLATVHFQARADEDLYERLDAAARQAGVAWPAAGEVFRRVLLGVCRDAAHAQLAVMAGWSAEEWRAAAERITPG